MQALYSMTQDSAQHKRGFVPFVGEIALPRK